MAQSSRSATGRSNNRNEKLPGQLSRVKPRGTKGRELKRGTVGQRVSAALQAQDGIAKADAARLFERLAAGGTTPMGALRAELIPDSSWKRAGKTLGPQASQTAARLAFILSFAERVWASAADAVEWLVRPHPELHGATPYSLLKTEAGGRAVEALLGALEYGFPV